MVWDVHVQQMKAVTLPGEVISAHYNIATRRAMSWSGCKSLLQTVTQVSVILDSQLGKLIFTYSS